MSPAARPASALVRRLWPAVVGTALALYALQSLLLPGDPVLDAVFGTGVQNLLGLAAVLLGVCGARSHPRGERRVWWLVTSSVALTSFATLLWSTVLIDATVSVADVVFLAAYLPLYAALVLIVRERVTRFHASMWLDGAIAALGMGAVSAAALWASVAGAAHGRVTDVLVNISYPLCDIVLCALLAGAFAVLRGRLGSGPLWLAAGLVVMAGADVAYALGVTAGQDEAAPILDVVWVAAQLLMAAAALRPAATRSEAARLDGVRVLVLPAAFAIAALGLLVLSALGVVGRVPAILAVATLVVVMVRAGLTFRENLALLDVRRLARTDELTGLLNRRGIYAAIDERLEQLGSGSGAVALLLLDLDRFKELNDTLGHHAGDDLLRELAVRLRAVLPEATLARLGGDEFVALVTLDAGLPVADAARAAGRRLLVALEAPCAVEGMVTQLSGSVGVACAPEQATARAELLRFADVAMYQAKSTRTGVELYEPRTDPHTRERLVLVSELHAALTAGELVLHFQPKADLATGAIVGAEALVRWQHPTRGLLPPDAFIAVAERHGLMRPLTLEVVRLALTQQRVWRTAGIEVPVAVNVSPANLLDVRFADDVAALLAPGDRLQMEITEETVMLDPPRALDTLSRLSELLSRPLPAAAFVAWIGARGDASRATAHARAA